MADSYINELRFFMKSMKFFGNLPLKNLNSSNINLIVFKGVSLDAAYTIVTYIVIIFRGVQDAFDNTILNTIQVVLLLLIRLFALTTTLNVVKMVEEIDEIDVHVKLLRGKQPFLTNQKKRLKIWVFSLIVLIMTSKVGIYGLLIKDVVAFFMYVFTAVPIHACLIMYVALCIALIQRQRYLCSECRLLFCQINITEYKGPDSAFDLMKIRHIHLKLMNFLKTFNELFSTFNLLILIYSYYNIIVCFVMSRFDEISFARPTDRYEVFKNFVLIIRTYAIYMIWCSLHNQFNLEVRFFATYCLFH